MDQEIEGINNSWGYFFSRLKCFSGSAFGLHYGKTLAIYRRGILAFYDYPSTGSLEGTNNKSKTTKRQADGFRNL